MNTNYTNDSSFIQDRPYVIEYTYVEKALKGLPSDCIKRFCQGLDLKAITDFARHLNINSTTDKDQAVTLIVARLTKGD